LTISSFSLAANSFCSFAKRKNPEEDFRLELIGAQIGSSYVYGFNLGGPGSRSKTSLLSSLTPSLGTSLFHLHRNLQGFTAAIVGGIGNVPGSILGSFLLGFAENFGIWFLPSGYKDAIAFVLLFIFLLFRPQGILGKKV
jgi:branched-chain amino acid transport system permease protein